MKEFFKPWNPKAASVSLLNTANSIITEYGNDGYTLTLRQLYYQFVARDIIENSERSYKNLGNLVTKARMAGKICWDSIEDRNREFNSTYVNSDPVTLVNNLPYYLSLNYWEHQPYYIEVWVEKEALGNVIERACKEYRVPHMACKGYLSASEAYRAGKRFERAREEGKNCLIIHLGDHDPSGVDMTRDNDERVNLFSNWSLVDIERVALNVDQIEQYSPPPNPTKLTDSRANDFIKKYGRTSYELDALEPSVIQSLIQDKVYSVIDLKSWDQVRNKELEVRESLKGLVKHLPGQGG